MSRAFVDDDHQLPEELPELPQSSNPGYITLGGLTRLKAELDRLENSELPPLLAAIEAEGAQAVEAETRRARVEQRINYLQARIGRAIVVNPSAAPTDRVHFGAVVTVRDQNGQEMRVHIVGEDETDPEHNRVSCFSPLAKALMSRQVGESVLWHRPIGDIELTVLGIESDDR